MYKEFFNQVASMRHYQKKCEHPIEGGKNDVALRKQYERMVDTMIADIEKGQLMIDREVAAARQEAQP